jgi:hypothetical protein
MEPAASASGLRNAITAPLFEKFSPNSLKARLLYKNYFNITVPHIFKFVPCLRYSDKKILNKFFSRPHSVLLEPLTSLYCPTICKPISYKWKIIMFIKIFHDCTPVSLGAKNVLGTTLLYTVCFIFRVTHAKIQETVRFYIIYTFSYANQFQLFIR